MQNNVLRAGIIGLGSISRVHVDALEKLESAEIRAVCDIDGEKLEKAVRETGAKAYSDWRELVNAGDVDIVHVLTPHYLHAPMSIYALGRGKHVLTEKPMATSTADALKMIEAADNSPSTLNVIFQNRYNDSTQELKRIIDSGEAGRLIGARAVICWHRTSEYYAQADWRGKKATEGGALLINQCIHTLDLISYLCGPIKRVSGRVSTGLLKDAIECEDNAHAVFEFESGQTGVIFASNNFCVDAPVMLECVFENGVYQLWAEKLFRLVDGVPTLIARGSDAKELGVKSYWGAGHLAQIKDVYDCILTGRRFSIDGRSAFGALALIEAIYKSSETGAWEELVKPTGE